MTTSTSQTAATQLIDVKGTSFAYREFGAPGKVPLVFLHHLTATLDDWDPAVLDAVAAKRHVIIFDNRGVGRSGGVTPDSVAAMAQDAAAFLDAKGLKQVDLLGYSLGGFVAQRLAVTRPALVRRLILAGTGPAGGEGISNVAAILADAIQRGTAEGKNPKSFLFFSPTSSSQRAGQDFLTRLAARTQDLDTPASNETIQAQVKAIAVWGSPSSAKEVDLGAIQQPVLVVNGNRDVMVPTSNSIALFEGLRNAQLSLYPDSGHGALFQHSPSFVEQVARFLD
jgi:pimeloyl-ACP methyl ester carboxylesterase